jgi:hypothetical protein
MATNMTDGKFKTEIGFAHPKSLHVDFLEQKKNELINGLISHISTRG